MLCSSNALSLFSEKLLLNLNRAQKKSFIKAALGIEGGCVEFLRFLFELQSKLYAKNIHSWPRSYRNFCFTGDRIETNLLICM